MLGSWSRRFDDMETELISSISLHWVSSPHDGVQISKASRRFCLKVLSWVRWEPMWFADRDAVMVTCHVFGVVAHFFINMDINFSIQFVLLWKSDQLESQQNDQQFLARKLYMHMTAKQMSPLWKGMLFPEY